MGIWDVNNFAYFAQNQSSHTIFSPKQKILDETLLRCLAKLFTPIVKCCKNFHCYVESNCVCTQLLVVGVQGFCELPWEGGRID